jgi:mRNA-degrading endonuclease HigB of HigAB toxin-antitoxin module
MVVISYGVIKKFHEAYTDSEDALNNWYRILTNVDLSNPRDERSFQLC